MNNVRRGATVRDLTTEWLGLEVNWDRHRSSEEVIEAITASFDKDFYLSANPDVASAGVDPVRHYVEFGAWEGRNPTASFDTKTYLAAHPGLEVAGINPFHHFIIRDFLDRSRTRDRPTPARPQDLRLIEPEFDVAYYRLVSDEMLRPDDDPVRHYLEVGAQLGLNPTPDFDTRWYLARYSDVRKHGINPFVHYLRYGKSEGREPNAQRRAGAKRQFTDFEGYLRESLLLPVLDLEFREEEKRCLAAMEKLAKELARSAPRHPGPLFSIIMPAYNRGALIGTAIESVLRQTYENFELLVVDDGSTDDTLAVARQFSDHRIEVVSLPFNSGVGEARNAGLRRSRGEYIAYLDSDNLADPQFLTVTLGAFDRHPAADAIYCAQLIYHGSDERPSAIRFGSFNRSALENHNYIDLNTLVHRRSVLDRCGLFDPSLRRLGDWDFALRLSACANIYSVPVLLSHYRREISDNSISSTEDLHVAQRLVRQRQRERLAASASRPSHLSGPVSAVIPSYQSLAELKSCVDSIFNDAGNDLSRLIIVDNGSEREVREYLGGIAATNGRVAVVQNNVNYGFTFAVNQGIGLVPSGDDVLIINNDARLEAGALEAMQACAASDRQISIVVPQQILQGSVASAKAHVPTLYADYEVDVSLSMHHRNIGPIPALHDGGNVDLLFAPFFCVYVTARTLADVDGLDAEFGRHYRSDRVFCSLVRTYLGRRIVYCPHARVRHDHQTATAALRAKNPVEFNSMFKQNRWQPDLLSKLGFRLAPWDL